MPFLWLALSAYPAVAASHRPPPGSRYSRSNVVFGTDSLVLRLTELEDVATVRHRPSADRIEQEVAVLMPEAQPEANQSTPCPRACPRPSTPSTW